MNEWYINIGAGLFWLSVGVVFYTYALFPWYIAIRARGKALRVKHYEVTDDLPRISILIAAYNEETVIEQKIRSVYNTRYPKDKLDVMLGSDNSSDSTHAIVEKLRHEFPALQFFPFSQRRGKGNVINDLFHNSRGQIIVFTDANVMLEAKTLFELVKYFKDNCVGLVDTRMINTNLNPGGISLQEKAYISREVYIKQHESVLWGTMMGPFGGCFAIRRELYKPVPRNFMVDDFYINMKVLEQGYQCINNLEARVYEDVSNNLTDEYRRKIRIATGNFQNLREFSHMLWHKTKGLSFCFISHKVLRWVGPFFLLLALAANVLLASHNNVYFYLLLMHCALIVVPLPDLLLRKLGINLAILRFITHFYSMNLALLAGFFKSLNTIESNVWKPTQRNQA